MNPAPGTIALQPAEIVVDRDPRRELVGHLSPRAAGPHHLKDSIDHLAHVRAARASARPGRRDRRLDQSPLTLRHVAWVWFPFHTPVSTKSRLLKHVLSDSQLEDLVSAIQSGRVLPPYTSMGVQRVISARDAASVANELEVFRTRGQDPGGIAFILGLVIEDRNGRRVLEDSIDLVTTGPEASGVANRYTGVVVRELFANAKTSVLVAGYAVHQGKHVFSALADRMKALPQLHVRMFLDIQRSLNDASTPGECIRRFNSRLVGTQWPGDRPIPTIYFYPSSLEFETGKRACLHAKCVVIDGVISFISSANFTEAAHERNIEVGVLIRSSLIADRITRHFDSLVEDQMLIPIPTL